MKRILALIAVVFLIFSLTTTEAMAQVRMSGQAVGCHGAGGHGCCHPRAGYYEPGCYGCYHPRAGYYEPGCYGCYRPRAGYYGPDWSELEMDRPVVPETVSGEVIDVYQVSARQGRGVGEHLLMKTNEETIDVYLGPAWVLENENFSFEPGESLEIRGSRVTDSWMPAMIATEVKKGNEVLTLRDEYGFPMWRR